MMQTLYRALVVAATLFLASCGSSPSGSGAEEEEGDPAEVVLGERLFLETRFAQSFLAASGGQVNGPGAGDPVMDETITVGAPLPGPFQGESMNCRACHLVDEQGAASGGGVRTYADFARRSPVPQRADGQLMTPRNSPALVNATLPRGDDFFLHFDAEFATLADLVRGTFTGRNFGWLPTEHDEAVAHLAAVIRGDDGNGALARDFGQLAYRVVLAGVDPSIPEGFRIPERFRLDVEQATDAEVLDAVAELVGAYVDSLRFAQDGSGDFFAAPYDTFLRKNGLPRSPDAAESALAYSRRLRTQLNALATPRFVTTANGTLRLHDQEFAFGEQELAGLRVFLAEPDAPAPDGGGIGNCTACHAAPNFTDFRFHNTGAAQEEYDAIHGAGAFAALEIPGLAERNAAPEQYLPPSAAHPNAAGPFLAVPSADLPGRTDIGVWNVLANPSIPAPQARLQELLCAAEGLPTTACAPELLLPRTIALFKTPGLRDLGQSAPYLHTGQKDSLEAVVEFYRTSAALARAAQTRNAAPELQGIALTAADVAPLAAFLRSLNEDYE